MNVLIVDDEPVKRDLIEKSVEGALERKEIPNFMFGIWN